MTSTHSPFRKPLIAAGVMVALAAGVFAWTRAGLLDLPGIPRNLDMACTGLAGLDEMRALDRFVRPDSPVSEPAGVPAPALLVALGYAEVRAGRSVEGLEQMRSGIRQDPGNLVLANAYRMSVFALRREFLDAAKHAADLAPRFPPHLDRQPVAFFEELAASHPSRETRLHLALAWADELLLFPALEIKAPASVESVKILTQILEEPTGTAGPCSAHYVPALYARGLNHLHRPSRLVWPETTQTPPDAAARDIGRCVAVGRRFGVGSPRLQSTLAIALGDAWVKAGRVGVARSWWQIAQNLCRDDAIQQAVRRRGGWHDADILDRLEEELDRARSQLDHPMTDLAIMWN